MKKYHKHTIKERKQTKNSHKNIVIERISSLISVIAPAMKKIKTIFETYDSINNCILYTIKAVLML
jgi:hypothetical protein